MFNDLRLAVRHLWRRKIYTLIILLSLIIGFTGSNQLISFLIAEENTDSFHQNRDHTFQVFSNDPWGGKGQVVFIPDQLGSYLQSNYPEVEAICQVSAIDKSTIQSASGEYHDLTLISSDKAFFSVFSFPLFAGSANEALSPGNILLSKEKAELLFGKTDILGNSIQLKTPDTTILLTISGILERTPENSHLVFDAIVDRTVMENKIQGGANYILLAKSASAQSLAAKINNDPQRPGLLGPGTMTYYLEHIENSYFNLSNRMPFMKSRSKTFIWVAYVVCGLIYFMAAFNFISLFLLSQQERRKEVGIKKTLGITTASLMKSSLMEITLYIVISLIGSMALISFTLPLFNQVLETSLYYDYFFRLPVLLAIVGIIFLLGVVIMIISVLYQKRILPIRLLRETSSTRLVFNKVLFTGQFTISIVLCICALTIIRQMNFVQQEPLGFNRNMIQLQAPSKEMASQLSILKQDLLQIPNVNHATICSGNPISGNMVVRYELENGEFYTPFMFSGDVDFVRTLNLQLLEGELPSETRNGKLVNEKLVHDFKLNNPVGAIIPGTKDQIVGVVKDFVCGSFKQEIPPVIISFESTAQSLLIDYSGQEFSSMLSSVRKAWSQVFPDQPMTYKVIQEALMSKYKEETSFHRMVIAFSTISMLISCFGLFALSWAVSQSRTKEIGIRKVLGASAKDILHLLSSTFIKRILLAYALAVPFGYVLMNKWLETFSQKIPLSIEIFAVAGIIVMIMALLTLSLQTMRAALLNPVDELRDE